MGCTFKSKNFLHLFKAYRQRSPFSYCLGKLSNKKIEWVLTISIQAAARNLIFLLKNSWTRWIVARPVLSCPSPNIVKEQVCFCKICLPVLCVCVCVCMMIIVRLGMERVICSLAFRPYYPKFLCFSNLEHLWWEDMTLTDSASWVQSVSIDTCPIFISLELNPILVLSCLIFRQNSWNDSALQLT